MAKKQSSAEKRHRQSEERRIRNKAVKTSLRTSAKKVVVLVHKKETENAALALKDMIKRMDTAARKGVVKKNTASRKKSRMQKLFNALQAAETATAAQ
ncbi:MAG: 30S ribosomal protein S20 [Spirochaetaceae bacterium]|jgi:small subunit ribosomal protein S20|nr:30S ribosomal protein S20 [Spirochaetaceae bacterium]